MDTFLLIVIILFAGYLFGRVQHYASFQNTGEQKISQLVSKYFRPPDYHLMNHVTLEIEDGTTQIDHILISRFGVFVIETKNYQGWIFANAKQPSWTQVLFKCKFKFQNPIFQNLRHVRAVQKLLDFLPVNVIKSVVVFTGNSEFKTDMPEGVFNLEGFVDYISDNATEVMSVNRMQFCVGRLETARLAITGQTDIEHVEYLAKRYGNPN